MIALIGSKDGIIRSRAPVDNELIGTTDPDIGRMLAGGANGTLRTDTAGGAVDRIASYRVLEKYPLVVEVALDAAEVFADYNRDRKRYAIAGSILTVLFLVVGTLLVRQRRRLLASSAALTATLENISQGILMVDANGNVPVVNRRAIELLGLPASLMDRKPTFEEILAYQLPPTSSAAAMTSIPPSSSSSPPAASPARCLSTNAFAPTAPPWRSAPSSFPTAARCAPIPMPPSAGATR